MGSFTSIFKDVEEIRRTPITLNTSWQLLSHLYNIVWTSLRIENGDKKTERDFKKRDIKMQI